MLIIADGQETMGPCTLLWLCETLKTQLPNAENVCDHIWAPGSPSSCKGWKDLWSVLELFPSPFCNYCSINKKLSKVPTCFIVLEIEGRNVNKVQLYIDHTLPAWKALSGPCLEPRRPNFMSTDELYNYPRLASLLVHIWRKIILLRPCSVDGGIRLILVGRFSKS